MKARWFMVAVVLVATGCLKKDKDTGAGAAAPASVVSGGEMPAVGPGGSAAAASPAGTWRGGGTYVEAATGMRSAVPAKFVVTVGDGGAGFVASFEPYEATLTVDSARAGVAMGVAGYTVMPDLKGVATMTFTGPDSAHILLDYPASKDFGAFSMEAGLKRDPR